MNRPKWMQYSAAAADLHDQGLNAAQIAAQLGIPKRRVYDICNTMRPSQWTPERDALLRQRWADGYSAGMIAAEIGTTRNAVIGKIHRLRKGDLTVSARRPRQNPKQYIKPPRTRREKQAANGKARPRRPAIPKEEAASFDLAIPIEQRKTLMELTSRCCRYPVGDPQTPDFFFCGGVAVEGKPYCEHHCNVVYREDTSTQSPFLFRMAA